MNATDNGQGPAVAPRGSTARVVAAVVGVALVLSMALGLVAAAWAHHRFGAMTLEVREGGRNGSVDVRLPLPGVLLAAMLGAARATGGLRIHTGGAVDARALEAFLDTLAREFESAPDGVYLEVENDGSGERVRLSKQGGVLLLDVSDGRRSGRSESVSIRFPAALAAETLRLVRVVS